MKSGDWRVMERDVAPEVPKLLPKFHAEAIHVVMHVGNPQVNQSICSVAALLHAQAGGGCARSACGLRS